MYQCVKCKFRVTNKTSMPNRCPYCGREGTMAREVSASDIIKDVDELL